MILFFDTETTGRADFRSPPDAPHQPHIVQLAAMLVDESTWEELSGFNLVIKPVGWTIPDDVSAIHGITTEMAARYGVPEMTALRAFDNLLICSEIACAHNFEFDCFMLSRSSERRNQLEKRIYCTMRAMTPICKLPGNYGDFKWPKLQEAYKHCFGCEFDGAHDALADVRACAKVYRWLMEHKSNEVEA